MEGGYEEIDVRLDGRCEGGLGQQRNDGGGCSSMRERFERVESPGTYATERFVFSWPCVSFGPPSRALVVITMGGINYKKGELLKIKAQMSCIWSKGCMLTTVCVLSDMTCLPLLGGGRKSWYIVIIILRYDSAELVSAMKAAHASQTGASVGLNMEEGTTGCMEQLGITESYQVMPQHGGRAA